VTDFVQNHPDGVVLAMDAMSLYFQATVTQVWSPVGHTPEIYVSGSRDHIHFYGALNLQTGHQFALPTAINLIVPNTPNAATATPSVARPTIRVTGQPNYDG